MKDMCCFKRVSFIAAAVLLNIYWRQQVDITLFVINLKCLLSHFKIFKTMLIWACSQTVQISSCSFLITTFLSYLSLLTTELFLDLRVSREDSQPPYTREKSHLHGQLARANCILSSSSNHYPMAFLAHGLIIVACIKYLKKTQSEGLGFWQQLVHTWFPWTWFCSSAL